jgi:hypothetical protein
MKIVSKEQIQVMAETKGWSFAHAEGFTDGETYRKSGTTPSAYVQIGIDEYSKGFRAGYYERQEFAGTASVSESPVTRLSSRRLNNSVESVDVRAVPAHSG